MEIHKSAISEKGTVSELGALWIDESKRRECSKVISSQPFASSILSGTAMRPTSRLAVLAILASRAALTAAQMQLYTPEEFTSLSSECATALSGNLSCSFIETGDTMYKLTVNLTSDILDSMCTDECKTSIASYRKAVQKACASDEYDDRGNSTSYVGSSGVYNPIVLPDFYFTNYDQRCLKDSQGNYCYLHLKSTDSQDECDECGLQMFQAEISNGYFYNDDLAEQFSSLTSSCGVSTLSVPTATSVVLR